jgi:hypothetical protein
VRELPPRSGVEGIHRCGARGLRPSAQSGDLVALLSSRPVVSRVRARAIPLGRLQLLQPGAFPTAARGVVAFDQRSSGHRHNSLRAPVVVCRDPDNERGRPLVERGPSRGKMPKAKASAQPSGCIGRLRHSQQLRPSKGGGFGEWHWPSRGAAEPRPRWASLP